jgi:release factor glutamine methyltransferase
VDPEVRRSLAEATSRMAAAGVPSARYDAESLLAFAAGVERRELWRLRADAVDERFRSLVERRAAREPLQHITGQAHFRYLTLAVGPGVFVPRPETELVAGAAVDEAARVVAGGRVPVVVDLCTGSGAIAASIATEVTGSRVYAVELDPAAHAWAARNLSGTGVELRHGDMAEAFPELDGTVDVVVTNPPYIPVDGIVRDPEVAEHDPALALWSGTDGLDAMRVVATVGARLLRPGGLLVAEHADLQGESAPAVFDAARGWAGVQDHEDLAGRPRFVTARRAG